MAKKAKQANPLVDAVQAVKSNRTEKGRRTLFLTKDAFEQLQAYCDENGVSVSALVDRWIADFLASVDK